MKKQIPTHFHSSYRLQLHKDFRFQEAQQIVPYLGELGVSHLYLSPILESTLGSTHGYDGTNPELISEERGGEKEFLNLVKKVGKSSLEGIILDIVPNHLACNLQNPAWYDVLEKGPHSKFWGTFDLKTHDVTKDPIVLPVLGKTLAEELKSGNISLVKEKDEWVLRVYDKRFPLNAESLRLLDTKYPQDAVSIPEKFVQKVLNLQFYSLRDWKTGSRSLNYRRFFDINELIGIRMEDPKVYRWFHKKTFELLKKHPQIQGLRIDHVDGLTFPSHYLKNLRRATPNIWVEKILGDRETLPERWPVLGSTGYEFSNAASRLFVNLPGLVYLQGSYVTSVDDRWTRFHDCVYESKMEILRTLFSAELRIISSLFYSAATKAQQKKFSVQELVRVIAEVTSALKVYRTYAQKGKPIHSPWLEEALFEVEGRLGVNRSALRWFKKTLERPGDWSPNLLMAIKRWEQLSGPVMAKGLEDTALYRYCPLLSLNGVGGEPDWLGDATVEFHAYQRQKLAKFPAGMNTSSTHDTKRSEDVLCRINVLSELCEEWIPFIEKVIAEYRHVFPQVQPRSIYFIVETILGAWPLDGKMTKEFISRIQQYAMKASREAKLETSWSHINEEYEKEVNAFIQEVLNPRSPGGKNIFEGVRSLAEKMSYFGAFNSLSFVTLKAMTPGLADFYQGCEMWDLSLVDPDNRRPVDYSIRIKSLQKIKSAQQRSLSQLLTQLKQNWSTGEIKQFVTWRLLSLRKRFETEFACGDYIPINSKSSTRSHFVSFMRKYRNQWFWIIVPRYLAKTEEISSELRLDKLLEKDDDFVIPKEAPRYWENVFTKQKLDRSTASFQKIFAGFPVAVLRSENQHHDK